MQVISNRMNSSARSISSSKTNRKGLSLTSKNTHNSLPKCSGSFLSEETFESDLVRDRSTHSAVKFSLPPQRMPNFSNILPCQDSFSSGRQIGDMPKITFRFTNQQVVVQAPPRNYHIQAQNVVNVQSARVWFPPSQQLRNTVVKKSIQTRVLSSSKYNCQPYEQKVNPRKSLIDSRRVDRQIIREQIYKPIPTRSHPNTTQNGINVSSMQNKVLNEKVNEITELKLNLSPKNIPQQLFVQENQSPYRLLASTANRAQSNQSSPSLSKQMIKNTLVNGSLEFKNLQIEEFSLKEDIIEENREESVVDSQIHKFSDSDVRNISQKPNQSQISCSEQTEISAPKQLQSKQQILVLDSKQNLPENLMLDSKQSLLQNVQSSPPPKKYQSPKKIVQEQQKIVEVVEKKANQKQSLSAVSDIQNKQPEGHQHTMMSGRRNMKRFREIQKRLEQIIMICSNSL